jgi:hypothetical protein
MRRIHALIVSSLLAAGTLLAQTPAAQASKDDWEEINFEFDSSKLVDGFPSLLRIAELLQKLPGYRVRVEGHADRLGRPAYNEKLAMSRATAVRDFLVKYGARPNQIEVISRGAQDPKYPGQKSTYTRTDEARWMNRRVSISVLNDQGQPVSGGSTADAIRTMTGQGGSGAGMGDCCKEVLVRLDRLEEIYRIVKDLQAQNEGLQKEMAVLHQEHRQILDRIGELGRTGPAAGTPGAAGTVGGPGAAGTVGAAKNSPEFVGAGGFPKGVPEPPRRDQRIGDEYSAAENWATRLTTGNKFSLLGMNLGADNEGRVTFTGRGRYFSPFGAGWAFQAQAEYLYFRTAKEGQADFGLVNRVAPRFQAGLFGSFKHVSLNGNQNGGTLGQGAVILDYIFKYGKIGAFGTKAFLNNAMINSQFATINGVTNRNIITERYLSAVDQAGIAATLPLFRRNYLEGNVGYLKSYGYGDRIGGTVRLIFPITDAIAFTAEGGVNETMLGRGQTGRATFGIQFGNQLRPREFLGSTTALPMDVPRVRYEVIERTRRVGNSAPVADAGPDQIGVPAGTITLDGSRSYDPENDPITFEWTQESGPQVSLQGANTSRPSFQAAPGQNYSFRLIVRDNSGAQSNPARVRVSTRAEDRVQIVFFVANPPTIQAGQASQLSWRVINADTVEITEIGRVALQGTSSVSPRQTTTYRLTARNAFSEENATVTVTVQAVNSRFLSCFVSPTTINAGQTATINYQTENATSVSIAPGVGSVAPSGSVNVNPTATTTYVLTAAGQGQSATCNVTVTVNAVTTAPRIVRFSASPMEIEQGGRSTLSWTVENADTVRIDPVVGTVAPTGTTEVTPAQTTTYTLTATNAFGQVSATQNVTVRLPPQGPTITSFTADPAVSPSAGTDVRLRCNAANATNVFIAGVGPLPINGALIVVRPTADTTYECVANGANGTSVRQQLTVRVLTPPNPPGGGNPPSIVIRGGPFEETWERENILDASASTSPIGATPLTYRWTVRNNAAAILDANSPTTRVRLGVGFQDYIFDLTVTDARGNVSTATKTLRFLKTTVQ